MARESWKLFAGFVEDSDAALQSDRCDSIGLVPLGRAMMSSRRGGFLTQNSDAILQQLVSIVVTELPYLI
jgi:hypothetical protein